MPAKTHHITFICGRFRYIVSQRPDLCCGELEPIRNVGQEVKNKEHCAILHKVGHLVTLNETEYSSLVLFLTLDLKQHHHTFFIYKACFNLTKCFSIHKVVGLFSFFPFS